MAGSPVPTVADTGVTISAIITSALVDVRTRIADEAIRTHAANLVLAMQLADQAILQIDCAQQDGGTIVLETSTLPLLADRLRNATALLDALLTKAAANLREAA